MTTRTEVTATDLFVLLDREFRRRRPRDCSACFVQLPYRVDTLEAGAPNWEIVLPPQCDNGCTQVLEEIVQAFQARYALKAG